MRRAVAFSCVSLLGLASAVAVAQDGSADPKRPETPRESPGGAYDKLPDVAKQMIESAEKKAAAGAGGAAAASFTPLAGIETQGTGATHLVLIPGLASDWTVWESFMRRNAGTYTMHAVTLAGVGESKAPPTPDAETAKWSDDVWLSDAERSLVAAIAGLKLEKPPVVMGHSLGGLLALRLALRHPEAVRGAVMLDAYAAWPLAGAAALPVEARRTMVDNQMASWFDSAMAGNDMAGLKRMFQTGTLNEGRGTVLAQMAAKTPADVSKRYMLELCASDLTGELGGLKVPVLVMAAIPPAPPAPPALPEGMEAVSNDRREQTREMWRTQFRTANQVTLEFVEGSGHFIMDDQPGRMDVLLGLYLDRVKE